MKTKLIGFLGAPCSGKSTLASELHTRLKTSHKNSIFLSEAATDYIAEFGIPSSPIDQMTIYYQQRKMENMYFGSKEYIVCDSSSILNYFYFRKSFTKPLTKNNIASINNIQKEILLSINDWAYLFYVPPITSKNVEDGIRFHNVDEIKKIDNNILSYLDIENIDYTNLSDISVDKRVEHILNMLNK